MPNARSEPRDPRSVPVLPEWDEPRPAGAQRLLEAAVVSFAERGYHGVSVRDLASAAGVKAASVYAHFPSKEALLAELVLHGHRAHHVAVREAILGAGSDPQRPAARRGAWPTSASTAPTPCSPWWPTPTCTHCRPSTRPM